VGVRILTVVLVEGLGIRRGGWFNERERIRKKKRVPKREGSTIPGQK